MTDDARRLVVGWMRESLERAAVAREGERRTVQLPGRENRISERSLSDMRQLVEVLAAELQDRFGEKSKEELEALCQRASVAGRVMARRGPFIVIQDMSGRIQFYIDKKNLPEELVAEIKGWDLGDIVGGEGPVHKSGKGDLYIYVDKAALLTKALRPLPEKWHGLSDQEQRYRQRYVDLIVNAEVRNTFILRSRIIEYIRRYFVDAGFLEVETPMMQVIPGGAAAKPFVTHHKALDMALYLRIAPELYLKRLVVGGFEKVFEINRNFRNEGLSTRHNPEFTMLEFYWAYADFEDLMALTQELLSSLVTEVVGSVKIDYQGETLDFSQPAEHMTMAESLVRFVGLSSAEVEDAGKLAGLLKDVVGIDAVVSSPLRYEA